VRSEGRRLSYRDVSTKDSSNDCSWFARQPQIESLIKLVERTWGICVLGMCIVRVMLKSRKSIWLVGQSLLFATSLLIVAACTGFESPSRDVDATISAAVDSTVKASKVTPTVQLTATPEPTATTIPEIEDLRLEALGAINHERGLAGLHPVALGTNAAAQDHADDMMEHRYIGHWWIDGRKPYMVYTQLGGTSYSTENVAVSGWNFDELAEDDCYNILVECEPIDPSVEIEDLTYWMVYDDAHADWGHRDNILDPTHKYVNIGIAIDQTYFVLVHHFEGGDAEVVTRPSIVGTELSFKIKATGLKSLNPWESVSVYYDPPPEAVSTAENEQLMGYCIGGGFTDECVDPIASIFRPPAPDEYYVDLQADEIVADVWKETRNELEVSVNLGELGVKPGVYTIVVFEDSPDDVVLIELSAFK
jgi:hypothetical protein